MLPVMKVVVLLVCGFFLVTDCDSLPLKNDDGIPLSNRRCFNQCVNNTTPDYFHCMQNCSSSWVFGDGDCSTLQEGNDSSISYPCNPTDLVIKSIDRELESGEVVQHLYFSWTPCLTGIDILTGYVIALHEVTSSQTYMCIDLQRNNTALRLSPEDRNKKLWFIVPNKSSNDVTVGVGMVPRPFHEGHNVLHTSYRTQKCSTLNGRNSCVCGMYILSPPNITVNGYSVFVQFKPAPQCFNTKFYSLFLAHPIKLESDYYNQYVSYSQPENDQTILSYRFTNVFNSNSKDLTLTVTSSFPRYYVPIAQEYPVVVEAWAPPKPNITNLGSGEYEAWFQLPPSDFILPSYMFRVSRNTSLGYHFEDHKVNTSQAINGILRFNFVLDEGHFGIQVREVRSKSITRFFDKPQWGPVATVVHEQDDSFIIMIVILCSCLVAIVVFFVVFIWMLRTGKCKCFKEHVPPNVYNFIMPTSAITQKTILLIWQNDFRSELLENVYKDLVRSFGNFLALECGLEVIIDQCEEIDLSNSYAQWISNSVERADIVIFVCPHFDYSKLDGKSQSYIGNFTNAFSYMERSILSDQQKYVCAKFPFADLNLNSQTKLLHNMITSFEMMNEIEDLYFRIQGITKNSLFVRKVFENISESRYLQTELGRDLHRRILDFQEELKNLSGYGSSCSTEEFSFQSSNHQDPGTGRDFDLIPMDFAGRFDSTDEQETPLMVQSLSNVAPILESNSPVLKPRSRLEPIAPFTKDPNQAIREMNEASETNSKLLSTYPCNEDHYSSCDDLSSHPSYSIDVATASCFHTNELDSIPTWSHHQDEKFQSNFDAKIDETSPKYPAVHSNVEEFDVEVQENLAPPNPVVDSGFDSTII